MILGKTQIAVEFAYRYRHDYQFVLWTLSDTRESLVSGYIALAELLKLPKDVQDQEITIGAVKTWLQTHDSWLLILDNADDLAVVREFVPPDFRGHLLLTTRAQSMGRLAKRIEIETMDQDVGSLFLLRRAGLVAEGDSLETASPADGALAREICEITWPTTTRTWGSIARQSCLCSKPWLSMSNCQVLIIPIRRQV
jgi:hypothetical protein